MNTFTERLNKLVHDCPYTQRELAKMVGVTESAMSQYLSGDREPKSGIIANLATALNTTTAYLISGVEPKEVGFDEIYRFVTRSSKDFTDEEKLKIIKALSR